MKDLVEQLNAYSHAYYMTKAPLVSDAEYDALFDELLELERETGETPADSPTRRVGAEPVAAFLPHRHIGRLWSLDKVKTEEALEEWVKKARSACIAQGFSTPSFALEYKFDGLTVNLTYRDGALVQGATRGNGMTGEGILEQIKTVRRVPLTIPFQGELEVQGECFMRLSVLEKLNQSGDERLKNARNAAAGALRNLDPKVTASRMLDLFCYNVGHIEGETLTNQGEMLAFLEKNGFPVSPYVRYCAETAELMKEIELVERERDSLDFLIDGMVVKVFDFAARAGMGYTDRFPRWAIAYKFAAEEATTSVLDVTWEVGRTGKLTPLAHLSPVELAGATIRRATLNNIGDIERKNVRVGSVVLIRRSNDVIPEILGAVENGEDSKEISAPEVCPACGSSVEQRGAHLYCPNSLSCRPQIVGRLAHYASRDAMDIDTFSTKTADLLAEQLGLADIPSLYELAEADLSGLPGFGQKRAQKLVEAIKSSRDCTLGAFLYALGIPNVGTKTAQDIAEHLHTLENVRAASFEELQQIPEVGEIVASSVVGFFENPMIRRQIDRLLEHGVTPRPHYETAEAKPLLGKTVVITGTLEGLSRREAEALVAGAGADVSSSVSKKTDFLVVGEDAGSKLDKARELGIRTLSLQELLTLIGVQGS